MPLTPSDSPDRTTPPTQEIPAPAHLMRRGELCPRCGLGVLDYNGLLDLECPLCAYSEGPGGGCT